VSERKLRLYERSFPGQPALDTAVSRALLHRVAEGRQGESLRVHRPDDVLAFSILDRTKPGFAAALDEARRGGFEPVIRLAGGRAAVFHRETLAFAWVLPTDEPRAGIRERFDEMAAITRDALCALGVDARIGEVPGEYCPGEHSVNAAGRRKLSGVGQRVVRGAAHVGGVIVVRDSARVREALVPVYAALGLPFDPDTAGSVEDEIGPVSREQVRDVLVAEFRRRGARVEESELDDSLLELAAELEPQHRATAGGFAGTVEPLERAKGVLEPRR